MAYSTSSFSPSPSLSSLLFPTDMNNQQLDEVKPDGALNEALRQVGLADVILVNKIDLVTKELLSDIKQRIR